MRLKKRILVSIILCLLLPLLLIAVTVWLILHFQVQLISVSYNMNTNMIEIIQNSPTLFEGLVKDDFNELLKIARETPQQLSEVDVMLMGQPQPVEAVAYDAEEEERVAYADDAEACVIEGDF